LDEELAEVFAFIESVRLLAVVLSESVVELSEASLVSFAVIFILLSEV
jgi:hypothetical protein